MTQKIVRFCGLGVVAVLLTISTIICGALSGVNSKANTQNYQEEVEGATATLVGGGNASTSLNITSSGSGNEGIKTDSNGRQYAQGFLYKDVGGTKGCESRAYLNLYTDESWAMQNGITDIEYVFDTKTDRTTSGENKSTATVLLKEIKVKIGGGYVTCPMTVQIGRTNEGAVGIPRKSNVGLSSAWTETSTPDGWYVDATLEERQYGKGTGGLFGSLIVGGVFTQTSWFEGGDTEKLRDFFNGKCHFWEDGYYHFISTRQETTCESGTVSSEMLGKYVYCNGNGFCLENLDRNAFVGSSAFATTNDNQTYTLTTWVSLTPSLATVKFSGLDGQGEKTKKKSPKATQYTETWTPGTFNISWSGGAVVTVDGAKTYYAKGSNVTFVAGKTYTITAAHAINVDFHSDIKNAITKTTQLSGEVDYNMSDAWVVDGGKVTVVFRADQKFADSIAGIAQGWNGLVIKKTGLTNTNNWVAVGTTTKTEVTCEFTVYEDLDVGFNAIVAGYFSIQLDGNIPQGAENAGAFAHSTLDVPANSVVSASILPSRDVMKVKGYTFIGWYLGSSEGCDYDDGGSWGIGRDSWAMMKEGYRLSNGSTQNSFPWILTAEQARQTVLVAGWVENCQIYRFQSSATLIYPLTNYIGDTYGNLGQIIDAGANYVDVLCYFEPGNPNDGNMWDQDKIMKGRQITFNDNTDGDGTGGKTQTGLLKDLPQNAGGWGTDFVVGAQFWGTTTKNATIKNNVNLLCNSNYLGGCNLYRASGSPNKTFYIFWDASNRTSQSPNQMGITEPVATVVGSAEFQGWCESIVPIGGTIPTGVARFGMNDPIQSSAVSGSNLYAIWKPRIETFTVHMGFEDSSFNSPLGYFLKRAAGVSPNSGQSLLPNPNGSFMTCDGLNENATESLSTWVPRTGYIFVGYSLIPNDKSNLIAGPNGALNNVSTNGLYALNGYWMFSANLSRSIYAIWEPVKYQVTFKFSGDIDAPIKDSPNWRDYLEGIDPSNYNTTLDTFTYVDTALVTSVRMDSTTLVGYHYDQLHVNSNDDWGMGWVWSTTPVGQAFAPFDTGALNTYMNQYPTGVSGSNYQALQLYARVTAWQFNIEYKYYGGGSATHNITIGNTTNDPTGWSRFKWNTNYWGTGSTDVVVNSTSSSQLPNTLKYSMTAGGIYYTQGVLGNYPGQFKGGLPSEFNFPGRKWADASKKWVVEINGTGGKTLVNADDANIRKLMEQQTEDGITLVIYAYIEANGYELNYFYAFDSRTTSGKLTNDDFGNVYSATEFGDVYSRYVFDEDPSIANGSNLLRSGQGYQFQGWYAMHRPLAVGEVLTADGIGTYLTDKRSLCDVCEKAGTIVYIYANMLPFKFNVVYRYTSTDPQTNGKLYEGSTIRVQNGTRIETKTLITKFTYGEAFGIGTSASGVGEWYCLAQGGFNFYGWEYIDEDDVTHVIAGYDGEGKTTSGYNRDFYDTSFLSNWSSVGTFDYLSTLGYSEEGVTLTIYMNVKPIDFDLQFIPALVKSKTIDNAISDDGVSIHYYDPSRNYNQYITGVINATEQNLLSDGAPWLNNASDQPLYTFNGATPFIDNYRMMNDGLRIYGYDVIGWYVKDNAGNRKWLTMPATLGGTYPWLEKYQEGANTSNLSAAVENYFNQGIAKPPVAQVYLCFAQKEYISKIEHVGQQGDEDVTVTPGQGYDPTSPDAPEDVINELVHKFGDDTNLYTFERRGHYFDGYYLDRKCTIAISMIAGKQVFIDEYLNPTYWYLAIDYDDGYNDPYLDEYGEQYYKETYDDYTDDGVGIGEPTYTYYWYDHDSNGDRIIDTDSDWVFSGIIIYAHWVPYSLQIEFEYGYNAKSDKSFTQDVYYVERGNPWHKRLPDNRVYNANDPTQSLLANAYGDEIKFDKLLGGKEVKQDGFEFVGFLVLTSPARITTSYVGNAIWSVSHSKILGSGEFGDGHMDQIVANNYATIPGVAVKEYGLVGTLYLVPIWKAKTIEVKLYTDCEGIDHDSDQNHTTPTYNFNDKDLYEADQDVPVTEFSFAFQETGYNVQTEDAYGPKTYSFKPGFKMGFKFDGWYVLRQHPNSGEYYASELKVLPGDVDSDGRPTKYYFATDFFYGSTANDAIIPCIDWNNEVKPNTLSFNIFAKWTPIKLTISYNAGEAMITNFGASAAGEAEGSDRGDVYTYRCAKDVYEKVNVGGAIKDVLLKDTALLTHDRIGNTVAPLLTPSYNYLTAIPFYPDDDLVWSNPDNSRGDINFGKLLYKEKGYQKGKHFVGWKWTVDFYNGDTKVTSTPDMVWKLGEKFIDDDSYTPTNMTSTLSMYDIVDKFKNTTPTTFARTFQTNNYNIIFSALWEANEVEISFESLVEHPAQGNQLSFLVRDLDRRSYPSPIKDPAPAQNFKEYKTGTTTPNPKYADEIGTVENAMLPTYVDSFFHQDGYKFNGWYIIPDFGGWTPTDPDTFDTWYIEDGARTITSVGGWLGLEALDTEPLIRVQFIPIWKAVNVDIYVRDIMNRSGDPLAEKSGRGAITPEDRVQDGGVSVPMPYKAGYEPVINAGDGYLGLWVASNKDAQNNEDLFKVRHSDVVGIKLSTTKGDAPERITNFVSLVSVKEKFELDYYYNVWVREYIEVTYQANINSVITEVTTLAYEWEIIIKSEFFNSDNGLGNAVKLHFLVSYVAQDIEIVYHNIVFANADAIAPAVIDTDGVTVLKPAGDFNGFGSLENPGYADGALIYNGHDDWVNPSRPEVDYKHYFDTSIHQKWVSNNNYAEEQVTYPSSFKFNKSVRVYMLNDQYELYDSTNPDHADMDRYSRRAYDIVGDITGMALDSHGNLIEDTTWIDTHKEDVSVADVRFEYDEDNDGDYVKTKVFGGWYYKSSGERKYIVRGSLNGDQWVDFIDGIPHWVQDKLEPHVIVGGMQYEPVNVYALWYDANALKINYNYGELEQYVELLDFISPAHDFHDIDSVTGEIYGVSTDTQWYNDHRNEFELSALNPPLSRRHATSELQYMKEQVGGAMSDPNIYLTLDWLNDIYVGRTAEGVADITFLGWEEWRPADPAEISLLLPSDYGITWEYWNAEQVDGDTVGTVMIRVSGKIEKGKDGDKPIAVWETDATHKEIVRHTPHITIADQPLRDRYYKAIWAFSDIHITIDFLGLGTNQELDKKFWDSFELPIDSGYPLQNMLNAKSIYTGSVDFSKDYINGGNIAGATFGAKSNYKYEFIGWYNDKTRRLDKQYLPEQLFQKQTAKFNNTTYKAIWLPNTEVLDTVLFNLQYADRSYSASGFTGKDMYDEETGLLAKMQLASTYLQNLQTTLYENLDTYDATALEAEFQKLVGHLNAIGAIVNNRKGTDNSPFKISNEKTTENNMTARLSDLVEQLREYQEAITLGEWRVDSNVMGEELWGETVKRLNTLLSQIDSVVLIQSDWNNVSGAESAIYSLFRDLGRLDANGDIIDLLASPRLKANFKRFISIIDEYNDPEHVTLYNSVYGDIYNKNTGYLYLLDNNASLTSREVRLWAESITNKVSWYQIKKGHVTTAVNKPNGLLFNEKDTKTDPWAWPVSKLLTDAEQYKTDNMIEKAYRIYEYLGYGETPNGLLPDIAKSRKIESAFEIRNVTLYDYNLEVMELADRMENHPNASIENDNDGLPKSLALQKDYWEVDDNGDGKYVYTYTADFMRMVPRLIEIVKVLDEYLTDPYVADYQKTSIKNIRNSAYSAIQSGLNGDATNAEIRQLIRDAQTQVRASNQPQFVAERGYAYTFGGKTAPSGNWSSATNDPEPTKLQSTTKKNARDILDDFDNRLELGEYDPVNNEKHKVIEAKRVILENAIDRTTSAIVSADQTEQFVRVAYKNFIDTANSNGFNLIDIVQETINNSQNTIPPSVQEAQNLDELWFLIYFLQESLDEILSIPQYGSGVRTYVNFLIKEAEVVATGKSDSAVQLKIIEIKEYIIGIDSDGKWTKPGLRELSGVKVVGTPIAPKYECLILTPKDPSAECARLKTSVVILNEYIDAVRSLHNLTGAQLTELTTQLGNASRLISTYEATGQGTRTGFNNKMTELLAIVGDRNTEVYSDGLAYPMPIGGRTNQINLFKDYIEKVENYIKAHEDTATTEEFVVLNDISYRVTQEKAFLDDTSKGAGEQGYKYVQDIWSQRRAFESYIISKGIDLDTLSDDKKDGDKGGSNIGLIIGISVGAVALGGAGVGAFFVIRGIRRKKGLAVG